MVAYLVLPACLHIKAACSLGSLAEICSVEGSKIALCPADKGSDYDTQGGMGQQGGGMGQQGGMMGQQVPPGSMLSHSYCLLWQWPQAAQRL